LAVRGLIMEFVDETPEGEVLDGPIKPGAIRIILADSQAIYRVGIRKIFALEDDLRVVAQADSLENLRAAIERYPTDVVLLEGSLVIGSPNAISDLLRQVRLGLARHYLRDRSLSISEVAWLVGYSEVSTFSHAFLRWTGASPTTIRRPAALERINQTPARSKARAGARATGTARPVGP